MVLPIKNLNYEVISMLHIQGPNLDGRRVPCSDFEMNMTECFEAYGLAKGMEECQKFREDLAECNHQYKQMTRITIMNAERWKKVAKGEIPISERHGEPYAADSFVSGVFYP